MLKKLFLFSSIIIASCSQDNPINQPKNIHDDLEFTIKIENTSKIGDLKLSDNKISDIEISEIFWVVYKDKNPIFTSGNKIIDNGLKSLAEQGKTIELETKINEKTKGKLKSLKAGESIEFKFKAEEKSKLTFAGMFTESNDLFFSTKDTGIELFDSKGEPIHGDFSREIILWDAGTEKNEKPGEGNFQPKRQSKPDSGEKESNNIMIIDAVKDGFDYTNVKKTIKLIIENNDKH